MERQLSTLSGKNRRSNVRSNRINRSRHTKTCVAAMSAALAMMASRGYAASSTWSLTPDTANWENTASWDGGVVPGGNDGPTGTNADTASFSGATAPVPVNTANAFTGTNVTVDLNRNIGNIVFDNSATNFSIATGPNSLYLSNGGTTTVTNNAAGLNNDLFVPLVLNGTSYTFTNLSTASAGLRIRGTLSASQTGTTTIILDGAQGTTASSNTELHSTLVDPVGGILSVVKNGNGTWEMNASATGSESTYSGDTVINAGVLRTTSGSGDTGQGGFSINSNYIVNNGGTMRNSVLGTNARSVTLNPGGVFNVSTASTTFINLRNNSGNALTMNYGAVSNATATITVNVPITLTGTVPNQGGIQLLAGANTGAVTIGGNTGGVPGSFNLGTVLRTIDVASGGISNRTDNAFDLRIINTIDGGSATGGIVKTGAGILRIGHTTNSFTGKLEIQQGTVNISIDNALQGLPDLVVDGGTLAVNGGTGAVQTFGAVTMTKGSATAGSSTASTIKGSNFEFNVAFADSLVVAPILADGAGATALVKNGTGTAEYDGDATYTGGTTINSGFLMLGNGGANGSLTGNITNNGGLIFNRSSVWTASNVISGGGTVTKTGSGILTLDQTNTYSGLTTVTNGTLAISSTDNIGNGAATNGIVLNGGALRSTASLSTGRSLTVGAAAGSGLDANSSSVMTFDGTGNTTWGGNLAITGSGTVAFARTGGTVLVTPGATITLSDPATLDLGGSADALSTGSVHVDIVNNSTTTLRVTAGSQRVGNVSGVGNTTVNSSSTMIANHIRQNSLTVNGLARIRSQAVITTSAANAGVSKVNTLSIPAGGQLDLTNNKLIDTTDAIGTYVGSTSSYSGLTALIKTGRNGGTWNGTGGIITSESKALAPNLPRTTIAIAKASQVKTASAGATVIWAGQTITGTDTLLMYTYAGDANMDGKIDPDDYGRIDVNIALPNGSRVRAWANGDFNYDGVIDVGDYGLIDTNIALAAAARPQIFTGSGAGGGGLGGVSAVPEPTSMTILALGAAGLMGRRRRRK